MSAPAIRGNARQGLKKQPNGCNKRRQLQNVAREILPFENYRLATPFGCELFRPSLNLELVEGFTWMDVIAKKTDPWLREGCSMLGAIFLLLGVVVIREAHFPGAWALLPAFGSLLVIAAGPSAWLNRVVLSSRVLVWIGLISYPLYLWHWPLLSFGQIIESEIPSIKIRIMSVSLSFFLAWLTYQVLEKPFRLGRRSWKNTAVLSLFLAFVGYVGYKTYETNSLTFLPKAKILGEYSKIINPYDFFDYKNLLRVGTCHSVSLATAYSNGCISKNNKVIFIWGDSYAASLFGGLDYVRGKYNSEYAITQMTDGNGPPFFRSDVKTDDGKTLSEANNIRLNVVAYTTPKVVLMTWLVDGSSAFSSMKETVSSLKITVERIKEVSPSSRIIILGPFPKWKGSLLKQMVIFSTENKSIPPAYMEFGLDGGMKDWDDYFRKNIPKLDVEYISIYDVLCNEKGCLTRTSDNAKDITAIDFGHLTKSGSIYLIEKIRNSIFIK